ncbi:MAG: hypothetical protein E6G56_07405 [Actinobacteria bacterium]|nr:MAG: hypothetical protein E6G56_07405 [Actinomycetota bacterium]
MATVAVFVALGGTAAATVLISSNRQVARNTISGHNPPSGKHPNLIAGSVSTKDLSPGLKSSLASLKLHCPADTQQAGDVCFERPLRTAATFEDALKTCARAGRRLPSDAELTAVFEHSGAPQAQQWVATHHRDANGTALSALGATLEEDTSRNFGFRDTPLSNTFPFRCVTSPAN